MRKFVSILICIVFLMNTIIQCRAAQGVSLSLPPAGSMVGVSPVFIPPVLKGIKVDLKQPFGLEFILDDGSAAEHPADAEVNKLIRYFLASLTIPEKDLWVNLSPYEKDRIIPNEFSQTEMGRDLLAQDYMLKQITASLIYPENATGRAFWREVYAAAYEKYGTTDVPLDTFNKVWIVPNMAAVYENGTKAYVTKATLKVMLETDYVAASRQREAAELFAPAKGEAEKDTAFAKEIIRQVIIPILEKEVNEGANFAQLRQVYYSLILAKWYKETLKDSIVSRKYSDQKKTNGVALVARGDKQMIYEKYLEAFKKGAFNYVREEYDAFAQATVPKKYFSGGMSLSVNLTSDNSEKISNDGNMSHIKVQLIEPVRKNARGVFNGSNVTVGADGFIDGDIHDLEFVAWERENALTPTIAFDLEGTLVYDDTGLEKDVFLREEILEQLVLLKQSGFRLVLWTNNMRSITKDFFVNKYPQVAELFDLFITGENAYPVKDRTPILRELYPDLDEQGLLVLKGINRAHIKDIVLFGYRILVDNDLSHFYQMAAHPYKERFRMYPIETLHRKGSRENVRFLAEKIMAGIQVKVDQRVFSLGFIEMLQEIEKKDPFLAGQRLYEAMVPTPDRNNNAVLFDNINIETGLLDIPKVLAAPSLEMIKVDPGKFLRKFAGNKVTVEKFESFSPRTQKLRLDVVRLKKGKTGSVIYALGITELSYEGRLPLPGATWLVVDEEGQLITMVQRKTGSVLGGDWEGNSNNYDDLAPFTYTWFINNQNIPKINILEPGLFIFMVGEEWLKGVGNPVDNSNQEAISVQDHFKTKKEEDAAQMNGGIDLNTENMQMDREGSKSVPEWGDPLLEGIEISGLAPVILQVTPMADPRAFMELPPR